MVGMYVTKGGGGGVYATLKKKHREQDYAIAIPNQHWVCKFEEFGWGMFLRRKKGKLLCSAALPHKN